MNGLKIGNLTARVPVIQGGMGVGISLSGLASAVANEGNCGQMGSSSAHPGSVHVLLLDGSAKSWRETVDRLVWRRLGGYQDGQVNEK